MTRNHIRFLLNGDEVTLTECGARDMLLDFLRVNRRLTGTKEGCAEGDCGACTVLVGRLHEGVLRYDPVNACIRPLAACDGCHTVTVEALHGADGSGSLHPVQRAMVEAHGTQCGFCTPGIVMALYALWLTNPRPSREEVARALQGNLCRCTGYGPILDAAEAAASAGGQEADALMRRRDEVARALAAMRDGRRVEVAREHDRAILPGSVDDLAAALMEHPDATIVAGATDVGLWVTKHLRDIAPALFIAHLPELRRTDVDGDTLIIGAGVTWDEAEQMVAQHLPEALPYWHRVAGWQVRAAGTVGGNIANGSPIGDSPPLLIALGAEVTLRQGDARRTVPLERYFIAYGKQDRQPGEFVESIRIPLPAPGTRIAAEKISKRPDSDITAVAMGLALTIEDGRIATARIAYGGMAGIPRRAPTVEAALTGAPLAEASFEAAAQAVAQDFTPLSDWRASADYRRLVAGNLIRRFWLSQPEAQREAAE
ncbi:xanthine dehydrogenase small subunit [Paracoccus sp. S-4012]|uniref:xanthine dehydrogenase small subunit n=1 Tax=Paracoccus sp. S-4012 TaxID=2665648 RepID=UPI0012B157CF|nr:xanthine dehydrogenase small subunit [Paracoccus sp. S-4012]MRX49437.1 xanthine dehydrogenase small subunit [Paracoccus sp. S-4012]